MTHDQEEALAMSDEIFVLNAGHIEQSGTPMDIYDEPINRYVADFIGESNIVSGTMDIGNIVLRDRRILSEEGLVIVVVSADMEKKKIVSGPDIISRGFVYMRESGTMINEAQQMLNKHLRLTIQDKPAEWSELKNEITDVLSPYLYEKTKRRPMILPIIMEV